MTKAQAIYYAVLGALSAAGSALAQSLGGWDGLLQILVTLTRSAWRSPWCGSSPARRRTARSRAAPA